MIFIGVTTHTDDFSELRDSELKYLDNLKQFNMTPVLLRNTCDFVEIEEQLNKLDGLLLIGGEDVHPCHYGRVIEEDIEYMDFNRDRDLCELQLARRAYALDLPTLGVCRGSQIMNVSLGGSLIPEIQHGNREIDHHQEEPYDVYQHKVHIQPGTRLHSIYFGEQPLMDEGIDWVVDVNSMHHQAIEHPAYGLYVNAISTDGVYEGIEDPTKKLFLGVQWHPEYLPNSGPIFQALRDAAALNAESRAS